MFLEFSKDFHWFAMICYGDAKTQKIMTNRCLRDPKLHNCALSQIVYVSKYTREALCCILSFGFEVEALFILQNHDNPWFFHGFALQNHGFPWICLDSPVKHFTVPPTRLPRGSSPPWELPRPRAQKSQKSWRSSKKRVPENSSNHSRRSFLTDPLLNHLRKNTNGIYVWSRCICHSVKIPESPGKQTDKPWPIGSWYST